MHSMKVTPFYFMHWLHFREILCNILIFYPLKVLWTPFLRKHNYPTSASRRHPNPCFCARKSKLEIIEHLHSLPVHLIIMLLSSLIGFKKNSLHCCSCLERPRKWSQIFSMTGSETFYTQARKEETLKGGNYKMGAQPSIRLRQLPSFTWKTFRNTWIPLSWSIVKTQHW